MGDHAIGVLRKRLNGRTVQTVYVWNAAHGANDGFMPFPCWDNERAEIVGGLRSIGFVVRDPFEVS